MVLHIEQGKGSKDRYAILAPALLQYLRHWWHYGIDNKLLLKGGWLFPGLNPVAPLSNRQLSLVCKKAGVAAGLGDGIHLLLLHHAKLETTALYTQVATKLLKQVTSPLDLLPELV